MARGGGRPDGTRHRHLEPRVRRRLATLEPFFSHALSATCAALLVCHWLRERAGDRLGPWFLAGLIAGAGATVRYQDAVLLAVPGLDLVATRFRTPGAMLARGLALGAGALVGVLPQLAVNYHLFGNPFTTGCGRAG